ncbi:hypothetical protein GCM10009840_28350 [Pseudolysinimonas kribbensis]|uniref:HNH endonuclease signature motif containing protein n=1 Tax=Pseudolysinimonas kribbensis TaxID=433641 RepID=UPI0031E0D541
MDLSRLGDAQLLDRQRVLAADRRRVDGELAAVAAEIAYRSRPELGGAGLAQRLGLRTPAKLVEQVGQLSPHDANVMVRVGELTGPIADAVAAGDLSLDAADAIRAIESPELEGQLIAEAAALPPRRLAVRARQLRDEADADGVADREALLRSRRYLHLVPQPDGMTRLSGLLDPESAAIVTAAYDGVTSPRRGGVRFVDPDAAPDLTQDDRTIEQLALDGLAELIRIGSTAGSDEILGASRPAVRVHVTAADLDRRSGSGALEGQTSAISIATVERHVCATGYLPILFDEDQPLDVGRSQRLFTTRQRIALAARDGGCLFPRCDRPPTWCEAHHITPWHRGGTTDVADGVLLCRHHHLLIHNNGWHITRTGNTYSLVPPRSIDPTRTPIPLHTKAPVRTRRAA